MRLPLPLRFVIGHVPPLASVREIAVMGSGTEPEVQRLLDELRRTFPAARILLLCDPDCGARGADERIGLDRMAADRRGTLRLVRARRPDLGVLLVNGSWAFWKQWLLGSTLGARAYMLFNRHGGGFFARPAALADLWRTLFASDRERSAPLLRPLFLAFGRLLGLGVLAAGEGLRRLRRRPELRPAFLLARPRGTPLLASVAEPAAGGADAEFTGERFVPGVEPDLELEHVARYRFAAALAAGRSVLDAGSGEGYGTAILARVAREAVGIDVSAGAVAHAARRYPAPNLRYQRVEPDARWPFADGTFDLVTSFEVVEHVVDWRGYLAELARVVRPDGQLVISTPNRPYYRDERGEVNEFHVHEFDLDEFRAELAVHFPQIRMLAQNHVGGVLIEELDGSGVQVESALAPTGRELATSHFFVAVCGREPLPELPGLLFVDTRGNQLRERERELRLLRAELQRARDAYERLTREFDERTRWTLDLNAKLHPPG